MDLGLKGKVAIVTGGASGFGEATAHLLAEEGARLVLADIQDEKGQKVTQEIEQAGGEAIYVRCDVSQGEEVKKMVDRALEAFGTVDILCNIAGSSPRGRFPEISVEDWDAVFAVHMRGTFLCTQEVTKRAMIPKGGGKIVNVGSLNGHGVGGLSAYGAAKAAIIGFTKNAARTLGPYGINVNCVSPGQVRTPMTERWITQPEAYERVKNETILKRVGDAMSIAPAIVFLCSEPASYITAADMNVSAGQVVY